VSLLGRAALLMALAAAIYAVVMALASRKHRRRAWQESAERGVYAVFGFTSVAMLTMWVALLTDSFGLRYVNGYSSSTLAWPWKISALWASQPGSLLLWAWLLTVFAALALRLNRTKNRELMPVAVAVLMGIAIFFTTVLSFITSPFERLATVPVDGAGLNPLLQNGYMVSHPPVLYLGYVALAVPFAFAISALVTRRLDAGWIVAIRRWTIFAWIFLGAGILLGAKWAYEELAFGGMWIWDPVENAAFMPWLLATAFLHSVMVQERRGMLRVWNMSLVVLTFVFAVFGTFLTRSGIVQSVHAFGESTLGPFFLGFIAVVLVGSFALIVMRLPDLRSRHTLESYFSREAVFLANNILLVGLTFAVLWGTMYPVLTESVTGRRITVGQGFYDQIAVPIGVALLILTGVGPLVSWRKASARQLGRRLSVPFGLGVVTAPLLLLTDAWNSWAAGLVVCAGVFVVAAIAGEFWRGMKVRHALGGTSWPGALVQLVARNRRRYGGFVVHLGIVVLFIGLAGSRAFVTEGNMVLTKGQSAVVGERTFVLEETSRTLDDHKRSTGATLGVFKDGKRESTLTPSLNLYAALGSDDPRDGQQTTEVGIDSGITRDVYAVLTGLDEQGRAVITIFVNPLAIWVWIAGLIVFAGGIVAAWPPRRTALAPAAVPDTADRATV
jgi:cytochrome c-type biogenesis protein CcmF